MKDASAYSVSCLIISIFVTIGKDSKGDNDKSGQCPDVLCDRFKVQGLSELLQVVCVDEACFGTQRQDVRTIPTEN